MRTLRCTYCKKTFEASRTDARFCSDSCRVSYNRLPRRFSEKAGNSWAGMNDIFDLATRFPEKMSEAEKQIQWLQDSLTEMRLKLLDVKYGKRPYTP